MRTGFLAVYISVTLFATNVFAHPLDSSRAAAQEQDKTRPVIITAVVRAYQADKTLQLDANGTAYTYDLSQTEVTYKIDANIRVGGTVKVTDQTDSMGHQTVSVVPVNGSK